MSSAYCKLPPDTRACICSICICGRHNCPGVYCMQPLNGSSHYRDTFTPKKGDRDDSPRQRAPPISTKAPPGHFSTTYQTANNPILTAPMERVQPYKPHPTVSASAPFDGKTTMKTDFPGHMPKLPPRPPVPQAMPRAPGIYDTTLGAMQQPVSEALKNGTVQRATTAGKRAQQMPHLPFDGVTSYTAHYPPKKGDVLKQFSPRASSASPGRDNRDFLTTKAIAYVPPPVVSRPPCPASLAPIRPASRDGHIKVEKVPVV